VKINLSKHANSENWLASQLFLDEFSLLLHREIAARMRRNSREILKIAKENLNRWIAAQGDVSALLEWKDLLENNTPEKLARIITQKNGEGQRLRSSSPFAGVLSESEREAIWRKCAERAFA